MRQHILCILSLWALSFAALSALSAPETDTQVLIFCHGGEVNLLYSSRLDSIVLSQWDADSVWHATPVVQRFHTPDTVLTVPIADIDSVAIGSRNKIAFQPGVQQVGTREKSWMLRYDSLSIYYKADTPHDILPTVGLKLFAQRDTTLFPIGLMAQVTAVESLADGIKVSLKDVELRDIFSELFYAGKVEWPVEDAARSRGFEEAPMANRSFDLNLEVGQYGRVYGSYELDLDGDIVAHPLQGFYSFEADMRQKVSAGVRLSTDKKAVDYNHEYLLLSVPLGVYALVFTPELVFSTFCDVSAEMQAELSMSRESTSHISWRLERGEQPRCTVRNYPLTDGDLTTQVGAVLNGEIFCGGKATLDFNVLRNHAGMKLALRSGPCYSGNLGVGFLRQAHDYQAEGYAQANLSCCMKVDVTASAYYRSIFEKEAREHAFFQLQNKFFERSLDLFPRFAHTRAVAATTEQEQEITVATQADNTQGRLLSSVETGFELVDKDNKVVDSIFVGPVSATENTVQGLQSAFSLPQDGVKLDELRVRPVFHYAGYTVSHASAGVLKDMFVQPMVASHTNGVVTALTGIPVQGQAQNDSTLFVAGPWLPVAPVDSVFSGYKPGGGTGGQGITPGQALTTEQKDWLLGTWSGTEMDHAVEYTFEADGKGQLKLDNNATDFTYQTDQPQSGRIVLYLDGQKQAKVLYMVEIKADRMSYRLTNQDTLITLTKITY